ncbi:MAG: hypothetical protein ACJAXH_000010 [Colwellia sp.]|jgi:hypothetical protein
MIQQGRLSYDKYDIQKVDDADKKLKNSLNLFMIEFEDL